MCHNFLRNKEKRGKKGWDGGNRSVGLLKYPLIKSGEDLLYPQGSPMCCRKAAFQIAGLPWSLAVLASKGGGGRRC